MDEDIGVKAPVTRLRRRMSVEAEDSPLPTTPSTPTKKRTTRLAAKPQLELIDEIATEKVPKKTTRKAAVKEIEADPNVGTPTAAVTPSRRSTRIRSNSSILSETTTLNVESPRAKRALRRTSQLDSDTESAPVTPARQTRRTAKYSAANVDKPAEAVDENVVTTTNVEDSDKVTPKESKENVTPSSRKSPRFNKKDGKADDETEKANKESNKTLNDSVLALNPNKTPRKSATPVKNTEIIKNSEASPKVNKAEENVSTSSISLMDERNNKKDTLNKSTSAIEKMANNRNRTKSWTTLSSPSKAGFISDNEEAKETIKGKTPNTSISGSGDATPTKNANKLESKPDKTSPNSSVNTSVTSLMKIVTPCVVSLTRTECVKSDTVKLFENSPNHQQPFVLIEDSDSCSVGKLCIDIQDEDRDQCVPEVHPTIESPTKHEQSFEPMDIDETVPLNVTIDDYSDKSNTSKDEIEIPDKRKSSVSDKSIFKDDTINMSKRKSSISVQAASESPKFSTSDKDKNKTMNLSKNSSKMDSSLSAHKLNDSTKEKSKRTSSISQDADGIDGHESKKSKDKSLRKSTIGDENNANLDESVNKSKRTSSISQDADGIDGCETRKSKDKSLRKSSIGNENNANLEESANKSKITSSVSQNNSNVAIKSLDNTQKNSSMSIDKENIGKPNNNSNKSGRNSSISLNNSAVNQKSITDVNNDSKISNKSKRNSISQTDLQSLENKSTLVISQLKDVSANETNNIMSPNVTTNVLSKSLNGPDVKTNRVDKNNLSLNYLTSTPIQQKSLQKVAMQINTSIISPAVENTNKKTPKKNESMDSDALDQTDEEIKFKNKEKVFPKKKYSRAPSSSDSSDDESDTESQIPIKKPTKKSPIKKQLESSDSEEESDSKTRQNNKKTPDTIVGNQSKSESKTESKSFIQSKEARKESSSDSSDTSDDSDEEPSKDKSKMVDDEASEASDDYESGDSQNEEERRYVKENEVVEKGETLDSEEDLSDDSDYEKDSFLVSSDADDQEMLSGTGDDLAMSDNELTMSAKSKHKYNERKSKQQKKASREMYEARHKKDESADSSNLVTAKSKKNKRQRLESSNLESENENTEPKKSNRLRIDSSQDDSMINSDADESIRIKKKKSKRLSESLIDTTSNEKEVTIFNQSTTEKCDPLSVAIKQEPKTPLKNFNISSVAINDNIEEVQVDANASILRRNETSDPLQATLVNDDDSSSSDNMEILDMYDSVLSNLTTQNNKIKTVDTSLNLNKKSKKTNNPVIDQLNLTQSKKSKINKSKQENPKFTESVQLEAKESSEVVDENSSDSIDMKLLFPEDSNDSEINASQFEPKILKEPAETFIPLKRTDAQTNIPGNMDKYEYPDDTNIKIIIDTTGTHGDLDMSVALTNSSKKKKNNKSLNESKAFEIMDIDCTDSTNAEDMSANVSIKSDKKKKKNKHDSSQIIEPVVETTSSAKKSKKTSFCVEDVAPETQDTAAEEIPAEISMASEKKKKKNKHKLEASQIIEDETDGIAETPVEASFTSEKKKKKNKNKSFDVSVNNVESSFTVTEGHSGRKSKKSESTSEFVETQNENTEDIPAETSMTSEKKKKKKKNKHKLEDSQIVEDKTEDKSDDDAPEEMSYRSEKKSDATDTVTDEALTGSEKKKHRKNKKKNKKNKKLLQSMEESEYDAVSTKEQEDVGSAKRKRKAPGVSETEDATDVTPFVVTASNEKKKRKIKQDNEGIDADNTENSGDGGSSKKSKKNKKSKNSDIIEQDEVPQQNTKKRKHRDDDNDPKISKVSKQNSFDKIHVPMLPESVIKQLSEKPQNKLSKNKKKRAQRAAIATMPFLVEEAERRKNKPSNYLEQSIYLNDTPVKTKQKRFRDKPKVLPFIPTALTSDRGYTSQFNINVLPRETQFVAQTSNLENFRESFLVTQRAKKLATLDRFKAHRCHKISKF